MPTAPFWMATFSDMVTLLLTFFVMIVAMSEVEVKKFREALSYFQGRQGLLTYESVAPPPVNTNYTDVQAKIEDSERYEELLEFLQERDLDEKVRINLTEFGLHAIITDSVMFDTGRAELQRDARGLLARLADVMGDAAASVIVEGHTDDRPIRTSTFPSNWELSAARATSVVRFLLSEPGALDPSAYAAVGHGEFRPLTSNRTAAGRAQNRRVELFFSTHPWPLTPQPPTQ